MATRQLFISPIDSSSTATFENKTIPIARMLKLLLAITLALATLLGAIVLQLWTTPEALGTAAGIIGLLLLLPSVGRLARRISAYFQKADFLSPTVAFPLAYIGWFTLGSINFLEAPSRIAFGAFEPIPGYMWGYYGLGLAGYLAGVYVAPKRYAATAQPHCLTGFSNVWDSHKFRISALAVTLLMTGAYAYIVSDIGIPILSSDAYIVRLQIGKHGPTQGLMLLGAYTTPVIIAAYLWSSSCTRRARILLGLGVLLTVALMISLGGRGFFFEPALTVLVLRHYVKRKYNLAKLGIVLLMLFVAVSFYGYKRDLAVMGLESMPDFVSAGFPSFLLPYTYGYLYVRYSVATLRDLTTVIPSQVPYQGGWLTFQPLQAFLPGHHRTFDYFFKDILGNEFEGAGQPATLLGPLYADLGALGIFLGMAGFGVLSMAVYRWMMRERTLFPAMIYAWLVHAALFGLFISLFPFPSYIMVPALWFILDRFMRRSRSTSARTTSNIGLSSLAS